MKINHKFMSRCGYELIRKGGDTTYIKLLSANKLAVISTGIVPGAWMIRCFKLTPPQYKAIKSGKMFMSLNGLVDAKRRVTNLLGTVVHHGPVKGKREMNNLICMAERL